MFKALQPLTAALVLVGVSLIANAQQPYIDVEAERAQQRVVVDPLPQAEQGAVRSFPVTQGIPQGSSGSQAAPDFPVAVPAQAASAASNSDASRMFLQLQQLQEEVMELRGRVEEQAFEIQQLKQQSLERYVDLDRRISGAATAPVAPAPMTPASPPASGGAAVEGAAPTVGPAVGAAPVASAPAAPRANDPNEAEAYRAAYALVRNQDFAEAISAFNRFLQVFPDGGFTPNAYYWLGELYLVLTPPDAASSRRAFNGLLQRYPRDPKVPDALYKLGKLSFDEGDRTAARAYLERVVTEFADSNSSAVALSRDFLSSNFPADGG